MTIRARIALFGAGVVALTVLLFGVLLYLLIAFGAATQQGQLLASRGREAATFVRLAPAADLTASGRALAPIDLRTSADTFVEVLGASGNILSSSGQINGAGPTVPAALLDTARRKGSALGIAKPEPGTTLRLYVQPVIRQDEGFTGFVVAGQSLKDREKQLGGLRGFFFLSALFTLFAALAATWVVAGRALRPLHAVAGTADTIGGTADLSRRLPELRTNDEIGRLTRSFNGMLSRLEEAQGRTAEANALLAEALAAQQRFVADASHELRTPLTTIRSNAGFLLQHPNGVQADRDGAVQDIAAEAERMSRLVHDLLTLARADAGHRPEKTPLDLQMLLRETARQAQRIHPDRRVTIDDEPAIVAGNADALKQLLWILIDNAARHTQAGGEIALGLRVAGDRACLSVADDGTGIPARDLERIFERFYQADPARSGGGAGLGLAIARWIATEHRGELQARNNPAAGATFSVTLHLVGGET